MKITMRKKVRKILEEAPNNEIEWYELKKKVGIPTKKWNESAKALHSNLSKTISLMEKEGEITISIYRKSRLRAGFKIRLHPSIFSKKDKIRLLRLVDLIFRDPANWYYYFKDLNELMDKKKIRDLALIQQLLEKIKNNKKTLPVEASNRLLRLTHELLVSIKNNVPHFLDKFQENFIKSIEEIRKKEEYYNETIQVCLELLFLFSPQLCKEKYFDSLKNKSPDTSLRDQSLQYSIAQRLKNCGYLTREELIQLMNEIKDIERKKIVKLILESLY